MRVSADFPLIFLSFANVFAFVFAFVVKPFPSVFLFLQKYPGGQITVYYATQTGTAESFAQQLEREASEHGFFVHVKDMEDADADSFVEEKDRDSGTFRVILLASTYGEGEPPDNAATFVQSLKEMMADETNAGSQMNGLDFCVFGLGNRQYEHFNAMGVFFDDALEKLGGNRIMDLGLGDDDNDLEGDFDMWRDKLWGRLKSHYMKDADLFHAPTAAMNVLPECQYIVEYHEKGTPQKDMPLESVHGSSKHYFTSFDCPVTTVRELRSPEDGGSTVHVEIDISKTKDLVYHTADNLGVLPLNQPSIVESVAKALGYDLDAVFSIKAAPGHEWHGAPFPMPITIRECLTRYLDLTSAPRRSDLKLLAQYAKDPVDRKALARLSSKEGKAEYREKILDCFVGMVDLLKLCPSLTIPLDHLISICHILLPRFYTISSSSSVFPRAVHITVSVTQDNRKDGSLFNGVCSTYLASLKPGIDSVRIFNRPSTFRLPKDPSRPVIMIGPGTGVAPMRALLQERNYQKSKEKLAVGKNILYFGCKRESLDFIYADELKAFHNEGCIDRLYLAFSREHGEKVYVQHLLSKNSKETWNLIDSEKASIYVCGGVKMGHDVTETLKEILSTEGQMSFDNAKDYLAKLAIDGRFVQELWA